MKKEQLKTPEKAKQQVEINEDFTVTQLTSEKDQKSEQKPAFQEIVALDKN